MKIEMFTDITPCIRLSLSEQLAGNGWKVSVITRTSQYWEWDKYLKVEEGEYEHCLDVYRRMGGKVKPENEKLLKGN